MTRDDVFHVLRNRRRRYALHYLIDAERSTDIGDLAEQVAAWEHEIETERVTSTQRKRAYNSLQQTHLPTLDGVGLVEYDADRGTVVATDRIDAFDVYLDVVADDDVPWSRYYLALATANVAVVVAAVVDLPILAGLSDLSVTAFVVASLFVSAVVHATVQRDARLGSGPEPPEVREEGR